MHPAIHCGFARIDQLHNEQHHAHEDYVLTLMLAGYVTFDGPQPVQITPGMLTLVPPGTPHALLQGKDMQVYFLSFHGASFGLDEQQAVMQPFANVRQGALPIVKLQDQRLPWLTQLFEQLQTAVESNSPSEIIKSLIILILHEARGASVLNDKHLGLETRIGKALRYIELHSHEGISLKDVAHAVHLSPAHLATKMKTTTGYSVGDWINKQRLTLACERLRNTDKNVETIAAELGWKDVTHFIRQFKKQHDSTPAAWRRQQRTALN